MFGFIDRLINVFTNHQGREVRELREQHSRDRIRQLSTLEQFKDQIGYREQFDDSLLGRNLTNNLRVVMIAVLKLIDEIEALEQRMDNSDEQISDTVDALSSEIENIQQCLTEARPRSKRNND